VTQDTSEVDRGGENVLPQVEQLGPDLLDRLEAIILILANESDDDVDHVIGDDEVFEERRHLVDIVVGVTLK
jgi:hypothetical protein